MFIVDQLSPLQDYTFREDRRGLCSPMEPLRRTVLDPKRCSINISVIPFDDAEAVGGALQQEMDNSKREPGPDLRFLSLSCSCLQAVIKCVC